MSSSSSTKARSPAIAGLFGKRPWSALPAPVNTTESLNNSVIALKERVQVQSREKGNVLASFTTVEDMINVGVIDPSGKTLESRVQALEDEVASILARMAAFGIP